MRTFALTLILFSVFAGDIAGQLRPYKIQRNCPASGSAKAEVEVERDGSITAVPCSGESTFLGSSVKIADINFAGTFAGNNYFTVGSSNRSAVVAANHLIGSEVNLPVTISGTNKNYIASKSSIDVQGTVTNPTIYGQYTSVLSNATFPAGTGTIYGVYSSVDVGGAFETAYGGLFTAQSGGSGADGLVNITGVLGSVGMAHNADTTNAFGGDFWLASSLSTPSTVATAAAVRARMTLQSGLDVASLSGLRLSDWVQNGGTIQNSYGIYADTSIDRGAVKKYFIYSLSASPSLFSSDVYVSDTTKGIILKSPDGTCYRFTVANGGALSAGASVTCP